VILRVSCLLALAVALTSCAGNHPSKPVHLVYEVRYVSAAAEPTGRAHISYSDATGHRVTLDVDIPWHSTPITMSASGRARRSASAPAQPAANLQCSALTDQGPLGRVEAETGSDSCGVDAALADIEKRP
jgi:hypothetical protein